MNPLLLLSLLAAAAPQDTPPLTVQAAIDRALAIHPVLSVAHANVDAAAAEVRQYRASWLPAVSLDGSLSKFQKPMIVWPLHGFDLRNPPFFDTEVSQASLAAGYTLFDFGARASKVRAAEAQHGAAGASLEAAEQQLIARTVVSYLRVLSARGILAAEDQRVAALSSEAARARSRLAAGKAARVDTLRAAAELAAALADRVASASNAEVAEQDLARLTGTTYESVHRAALGAVRLVRSVDGVPANRATMAEHASNTNLDLRSAEHRADAASASVDAARAGRLPQFQASTGIIDRSNITGRWISEWQVGVGLSWPIFTGGARESAIGRAEASARAAREQVRLTRLTVEQQVDEARSAFDAARARVAALDAAVLQSAEVARITQLARDVGDGTQTDYLIAEAGLFRVRSSLVQARHAVIAARVDLARVLGELSRSWIATSLESVP